MATMNWKPNWWTEDMHGSAWDRIRDAMRRDWEQTKKDLHIKGGHELNQSAKDTVKQMVEAKEPIPAPDQPNPPKVIGDWSDVELPAGYGYGARQQYGESTKWNDELEGKLKTEWEAGKATTQRGWGDVKDFVRHGFEYKAGRDSTSPH